MIVVKVNDIYDGTETSINNVFTNINLGTSAIKNLSRILSIKAFENNVVATSELTTKVTEGTTTVFVTVEVSSSLLLLPEKPMMGRLDSPRVGYFTNPLLNYSDGQQRVDKKPFITRWRLEPKPEDRERYLRGELVEPPSRLCSTSRTPLPVVGGNISSRESRIGRLLLNVPDSRMLS